jgi:hypothetical protein
MKIMVGFLLREVFFTSPVISDRAGAVPQRGNSGGLSLPCFQPQAEGPPIILRHGM